MFVAICSRIRNTMASKPVIQVWQKENDACPQPADGTNKRNAGYSPWLMAHLLQ